MGIIFRFLRILRSLGPPLALMTRDYYKSLLIGQTFDWDAPKRRRRAALLAKRLARLGPTFIKLAQILASRADLFPGIYLDELRKLHDAVPPAPWRKIVRHFRHAFGAEPEDLFEDFHREPIASASLGQVHEARYNGQRVAVKILKPGIRDLVDMDLRVMALLLSLASLFYQNAQLDSLVAIFEEFNRSIYQEMDLVREAESIRYFRRRYRDRSLIVVPEVIDEVSNRDVLVMEYVDGIKITDTESLRAQGHDTDALIERLLKVFGEQILKDGVFHADPHPGNIFVGEKGEIILVDFGLVLEVTERQRKRYIEAMTAVVRADYDTLIRVGFELNMIGHDVNQIVLRQAAQRLMAIRFRDDLGPLEMQKIIMQVLDIFYEFPIRLPSELVYVFKTASLIEGIGASYRKGYSVPRDSMHVIRELLAEDLEQIRVEDELARKVVKEGRDLVAMYMNLKQILDMASREEFAIRVHRRDMLDFYSIVGYTVRRMIALMSVLGTGFLSAMVFLHSGNWWVLGVGGAITAIGMAGLFLLPTIPKTPRIVAPYREERKDE